MKDTLEARFTGLPSLVYLQVVISKMQIHGLYIVSNVHFAATKDSLLQHFNKFGDVLKVIIVTDATTGQPKGSAYVEFTKSKEAEHALSLLDGTSFLSRILKVVKESAAPQEAAICYVTPSNF
ncbi:polyadenylate-binding protein 2 isoform X6 [Daucus carota subsp. sativus]